MKTSTDLYCWVVLYFMSYSDGMIVEFISCFTSLSFLFVLCSVTLNMQFCYVHLNFSEAESFPNISPTVFESKIPSDNKPFSPNPDSKESVLNKNKPMSRILRPRGLEQREPVILPRPLAQARGIKDVNAYMDEQSDRDES